MQIAFLLYPRFTALDIVGPYDVLSRLPDAQPWFVAKEAGPVRNDNGRLQLVAEKTLDEVPSPDILVVPGGSGTTDAADAATLGWIRKAHATSTWTTSVCTGSLLLASAGLLDGQLATSHWSAEEQLEELGAIYRPERYIRVGKIITAAGVSAGIDMALHLAGEIAGPTTAQAIQLLIEYDPEPPYDAGSMAKAPPDAVKTLQQMFGP
jgi:transcriptional regulator GlxA family with amidase domain